MLKQILKDTIDDTLSCFGILPAIVITLCMIWGACVLIHYVRFG